MKTDILALWGIYRWHRILFTTMVLQILCISGRSKMLTFGQYSQIHFWFFLTRNPMAAKLEGHCAVGCLRPLLFKSLKASVMSSLLILSSSVLICSNYNKASFFNGLVCHINSCRMLHPSITWNTAKVEDL